MINKSKKCYCIWSNPCKELQNQYKCCNFCNNKACDIRCKDDTTKCKFILDYNELCEYHKLYIETLNKSKEAKKNESRIN